MKIAILLEGETERVFLPCLREYLAARLQGGMPRLKAIKYDGRLPKRDKLKRLVETLLQGRDPDAVPCCGTDGRLHRFRRLSRRCGCQAADAELGWAQQPLPPARRPIRLRGLAASRIGPVYSDSRSTTPPRLADLRNPLIITIRRPGRSRKFSVLDKARGITRRRGTQREYCVDRISARQQRPARTLKALIETILTISGGQTVA